MKCFYHNDRDAVALCKSCSRALCPDCLSETGFSIACKNRCEDRVRQIDGVVSRSIATVQNTKVFSFRGFLFLFLAGLTFLVFGILNLSDIKFSVFLFVLGSIFIMSAVFTILNSRRLSGGGTARSRSPKEGDAPSRFR